MFLSSVNQNENKTNYLEYFCPFSDLTKYMLYKLCRPIKSRNFIDFNNDFGNEDYIDNVPIIKR